MKMNHVKTAFYSATGNTKKVVTTVAKAVASELGVPLEHFDFTLPASREEKKRYSATDLVFFGSPTYAGRIPNKLLPYVQSSFEGNGALAVPIVVFGNRSFDDCLMEWRNELEAHGFHTIAGAGVPTAHVFSDKLAPGRPNEEDLAALQVFGKQIAAKVQAMETIPVPIKVKGENPPGPYYKPLGVDGKPAAFLKAKPKTDTEKCSKCGICIPVCPMGSIPADAPDTCSGICIKCQACIKTCPTGAKYMDDPAFLSHVAMLEQHYSRRAEAEWFI